MTPRIFISGIVMASVAVTAFSVSAQESGTGGQPQISFSMLDADASGELSPDELAARGGAWITFRDSDGDGVLSRDEMLDAGNERMERRVDRMLERFDTDGDNALSAEELPRMPDAMFQRADADQSGGLSEEEYAAMTAHGMQRRNNN